MELDACPVPGNPNALPLLAAHAVICSWAERIGRALPISASIVAATVMEAFERSHSRLIYLHSEFRR